MTTLSWWKTIFFLCVFCAVEAILSPAQTFKTLINFDGTDGYHPAGLVQGIDGNFYGTTYEGGTSCAGVGGCGTAFKITPAGKLTTLYSFCAITNCTDGASPHAGLVQATDGDLYGTTSSGGANGHGTVFKITPAGKLTRLYSFCAKTNCTDGSAPYAGLVQATDRNFYGITNEGGNTSELCPVGCGTVFEITPAGKLTTLHSFDVTDGSGVNGLVQATNGNFYGTTSFGGANALGTVFEITPTGTLTTLYRFCSETNCTDGYYPYAGVVQATDGNFYGTTSHGGAYGWGTVFKITPTGTLTTLHSFDVTDGTSAAPLVQATDGNFYWTTASGGANGDGTVVKITPGVTLTLTTLHSFDVTDGTSAAPLVQATNGTFYGITYGGGAEDYGTVFSLSVGLGPFVEALTYSGKVGNTIEFLGQDFTSSTTVSFNGKAAIRKLVSGTYLTATVPSGATTGFVTVKTSGGTLNSNKIFRVIPQITSFSPASGPVGTSVTITGETLAGATSVAFDGVEAKFTVGSYTRITAVVPKGAKTGKIEVTTPGGTATSVGTFTVK